MLNERWRRKAYFKLHRLIGSELATYYQEFLSLETKSPEFVSELQARRAKELVAYVSSHGFFYPYRVPRNKEISLRDFPVLTKDHIQELFESFISPEIKKQYLSAKRTWGYSWTCVETGGSTGFPTKVIHDRDFRDLNRASRLYTQYMCGFPIGTAHFKLWGSMAEINASRGSWLQRTASGLAGEVILNAFRMEEADIDRYIKIINNSSIEHMMAYSDAAYRISEYILSTSRPVRPLKSVMSCAGTLTEEMRESISKAFGSARVHNMYGSRDCGALACECSLGALHVFENKVVLETVDEHGSPVAAGQPGRILVTLLGNYGFPLVRYDIGDVGILTERRCNCGLPTRLLERVEGRSIEFLVTTNGGYISPTYFRHLLGVVHNNGAIRRFQIIQHTKDHVVLTLEKARAASPATLAKFVENVRPDLLAVFGEGMNLDIRCVDRIHENDNGKFIFAINRIGRSMLA